MHFDNILLPATGIDDTTQGCTGYCEVKITTDPLVQGRKGNKVKILTVSARRCSPSKK